LWDATAIAVLVQWVPPMQEQDRHANAAITDNEMKADGNRKCVPEQESRLEPDMSRKLR